MLAMQSCAVHAAYRELNHVSRRKMLSSPLAMVVRVAIVAFMAVPSHQTRARRTCFSTPPSTSSLHSPFQGGRGRSHGYGHPRPHSTALSASKSKSKPKKKKNRSGGSSSGSNSAGGFGVATASAPTAAAATTTQPTTTAAGVEPRRTSPPRAASTPTAPSRSAASTPAGGQLPDDDFATFPPLSPDTLKSVMGVDVFDLPPRGIPASERGQEQALPSQVLECIRNRHGLEEFAGGRRLLDPKYGIDEDGGGGGGGKGLLFPGLRLLHAEPPVIGVDDFFTTEECDEYVSRSVSPPPPATAPAPAGGAVGETGPHMQRSATLGADVDAVAQRTSTTWFHRFSAVPELMAKASALVGVPFEEGRWEEAQTVRYRPGEKFTWHLDALPPAPELASKGGQRIATLLVYLTEMPDGDGGATAFRDLGPLRVRPRKGSALLFFPSCGGAPDCPFDIRTLHAGEVVRRGAEQDKWIAQLWLRESRYTPTVPKENRHADAESAVAEFDKSWRAS